MKPDGTDNYEKWCEQWRRRFLKMDQEELKKRLEGRHSETEEEIKTRLARIDYELSKRELYDYAVVNDTPDRAAAELEEILDAEKNKA